MDEQLLLSAVVAYDRVGTTEEVHYHSSEDDDDQSGQSDIEAKVADVYSNSVQGFDADLPRLSEDGRNDSDDDFVGHRLRKGGQSERGKYIQGYGVDDEDDSQKEATTIIATGVAVSIAKRQGYESFPIPISSVDDS